MLFLKILHFLAFAIGLGGGVANAVLAPRAAAAPDVLPALIRRIARLSFAAIVVLWITGFLMLSPIGGIGALGVWFWLKLAAALVLTGAALVMQVSYLTAAPPVIAARGRRLGPVMSAAAVLALVFAVLTFG